MDLPKVLVVDDDPDLAAICSLVLESEGYATDVATNGVDACKALAADGVDVVLMDVMMPVLDGISVCKMVKRDPKTHDLPVIIMSASEGLRAEARKCSADAVLEKPFDIGLLIDTVGKLASTN
jgi:CheY-like chemotaxis protein